MTTKRMTNREFSEKNVEFRAACEAIGIPATSRQAAKWRRGEGSARKHHRTAPKK
jgi:hypothetical protein